MRILIACEFSGVVRDAFRAKGHDAWSCDLLPTERPGQHIIGDFRSVIQESWDFIGFPPRLVEWPKGSGKTVKRWSNQTDSGQNRLSPSDERAATRAVTYAGIADAMAEQWGTT